MQINELECDVAVIGGGLGGCAAALAACEAGLRVVMSEPTDWIGGQVTSQAVSALDEHSWIESFGGTRSYYRFREGVRQAYIARYGGPERMPDNRPLNPGDGWVSRLCFEPRMGLQVISEMLAAYQEAGRLTVLLQCVPTGVLLHGSRIRRVTLRYVAMDQRVHLHADWFLDATDMGDLLPLAGVPYACGAEARDDTGEPHAAPDGPHPERVQSFTMCFFLENCPGENHIIRKPRGYEAWRDEQPFTLTLKQADRSHKRFYMFVGDLPFWTYRRSFSAALFRTESRPNDLALINWDSNDYYRESLVDRSAAQQARILREAKRLSLSFLYWLQTEAPHDALSSRRRRAQGFPGFRLVPEAVGTLDGLAKAPYIREGRRMLGMRRILEQDVAAGPQRGARATAFSDSVGVGWYALDLHRCAGDVLRGMEERLDLPNCLPFQIPLGAMLTAAVNNLIAAGKCLATTHLTNGAYRVHPVEWNIGESAGALAAFCVINHLTPAAVWSSPDALRAFQQTLLARGIPLGWGVDVPLADPDFMAIQSCITASHAPPESMRHQRLQVLPDAQLSRREAAWLIRANPHAIGHPGVMDTLSGWSEAPYVPFSARDWNMILAQMDRASAHTPEYPSLRDVCRELAGRGIS